MNALDRSIRMRTNIPDAGFPVYRLRHPEETLADFLPHLVYGSLEGGSSFRLAYLLAQALSNNLPPPGPLTQVTLTRGFWWGLCDMHGNAAEWRQDHWQDSLPGGSVTDYAGPMEGDGGRVTRGHDILPVYFRSRQDDWYPVWVAIAAEVTQRSGRWTGKPEDGAGSRAPPVQVGAIAITVAHTNRTSLLAGMARVWSTS